MVGTQARMGCNLRRRRVQAQAARPAGHDGYLALEGEEGREIVQLCFRHVCVEKLFEREEGGACAVG